MDIDERLKFLLASTESLHTTCQELSAQQASQIKEAAAQRAEVHKLQAAMLAAIRGYLEALGD